MAKLPVLILARHAYLDVVAHWRGLVQVGLVWLVAVWLLLTLAGLGLGLMALLANLVITVGGAAVAVAWHRHILEDAPLEARLAPVDSQVVRYVAFTILFAFLVAAVPLSIMMLTGALELFPGAAEPSEPVPSTGLTVLLVPLALLVCVYVALRLQLVFPAIAINERAMTLARSWEVTAGNGWRLFLGLMLTTIPVAVLTTALTILLAWLAEATNSIVLRVASDLSAAASSWIQAPLIAAFLSYAYLFFRQQPPQGGTAAAPA